MKGMVNNCDCVIEVRDARVKKTLYSLFFQVDPTGRNCQNNSPKECVFVNSAPEIQCHVVKKYTPTDCFFGDFAH